MNKFVSSLAALLAVAPVAIAQTSGRGSTAAGGTSGPTTPSTSSGFAPANFGDFIYTALPSDATSSVGTSSIFGTNGATYNFGVGGALVNPAAFNYAVTGPDTAMLTLPASGANAATTTDLTFTSANGGTYSTTQGANTTTGTFNLSAIPSAPPLSNVSVRTTLGASETVTVGFVVGGTMPRQVLVRAIGPGLAQFGVANGMTNPSLTVFHGTQALATNDDWGTMANATSPNGNGSSGTGNSSSNTGSAGNGSGSTTGTGNAGDSGAGSGSTGTGSGTNGPGAGTSGSVSTELANGALFTQLGAFGLTTGSQDAATVLTLAPGAYTVMVQASSASTTNTSTGTVAANPGSTSSTGTNMGGTVTASTGTGTSGTGTGSTGTAPGSTSTGTATATTGRDVLVEVYFVD